MREGTRYKVHGTRGKAQGTSKNQEPRSPPERPSTFECSIYKRSVGQARSKEDPRSKKNQKIQDSRFTIHDSKIHDSGFSIQKKKSLEVIKALK